MTNYGIELIIFPVYTNILKDGAAMPLQELYDQITPDMAPLKVAVVNPTDDNSLRGAFEAAAAKLITPVLVGPKQAMEAEAKKDHIDISSFEIVDAPDDKTAAQIAAQMAGKGEVEGLMKGKLHTDDFLRPIVDKTNGLRTGERMGHVFVSKDPDYHKLQFITDAAMNVAPDLKTKKSLIQNAIDLFWKLEGHAPKVAILAATEEVVDNQPATTDADALQKMAENGEIKGGIVAGPMAMDIAISTEAAKLKDIFTKYKDKPIAKVAGDADIFVFPDLASGNIYFKSRTLLSHAEMGGVILGAKVPIILTSRAADAEERKASAALALLSVRKKLPTAARPAA